MPRRLSVGLVVAAIVLVLVIFLVVGRINGGDGGKDLEPPTLTPSPSSTIGG